jgi:diguanylate cyclase (GGDEF)-like protein
VARPLLAGLALAGFVVLAVRELLGLGGALDDWPTVGFAAVTAGSCLWRAATTRTERAAWLAIGLGSALYGSGTAVFVLFFARDPDAPWPSIADALWLSFYPCLFIGLVALARARGLRWQLGTWLDGIVGALVTASLASAVVFEPVWKDALAQGTGFAFTYPLADTLLTGFAVIVCAVGGWRLDRTWLALGTAFVLFTLADNVYVIESVRGVWTPGGYNDFTYFTALILLAFAAWTPRGREIAADPAGVRAAVFPIGCAVVAVAIETADELFEFNMVTSLLTSASIAAIVARLAVTLGGYRAIIASSRRDAMTDPITGLGNRRRLLADLDSALAELPSPFAIALFDLDGFKGYNDSFGHAAGDALLARMGARLAAAMDRDGAAYRMGGDEFCVLVRGDADPAHATIARASEALAEVGEGFAISSSHGTTQLPAEAERADVALRLADTRMYAHKNARPESVGSQTRDVLVRVVREREPELHDHVLDVGRLAVAVGRRLGVPHEELPELLHAGELHDVGKLALPESILRKPGPLDPDEWEYMRRHTLIGERFLLAVPSLRPVAALVRASHERWDGKGYPDRLAGEAIPLGARIIAACDAFDAMITDRPYRAGMSREDAMAELRRCAGTQFDPAVVAVLLATLEDPEHRLSAAVAAPI